jgi:hypothetical protein
MLRTLHKYYFFFHKYIVPLHNHLEAPQAVVDIFLDVVQRRMLFCIIILLSLPINFTFEKDKLNIVSRIHSYSYFQK